MRIVHRVALFVLFVLFVFKGFQEFSAFFRTRAVFRVPRATGIMDGCTRPLLPPVCLQACPRGAVGVSGVDLTPLSSGGGQERAEAEAEAEAPHRFSCVGAEFPMLMRRDGAARVHEVCGVS